MKYTPLLFLLAASVCGPTLAVSPPAPMAELQLTIENPKELSGTLHVALHRIDSQSDTAWREESLHTTTQALCEASRHCQVTLSQLPFGHYAVRLFLDENQNGTLETSPQGIPLEAVGFSNNPPLYSGMPSPAKSAFLLNQPEQLLSIKLMKRNTPS